MMDSRRLFKDAERNCTALAFYAQAVADRYFRTVCYIPMAPKLRENVYNTYCIKGSFHRNRWTVTLGKWVWDKNGLSAYEKRANVPSFDAQRLLPTSGGRPVYTNNEIVDFVRGAYFDAIQLDRKECKRKRDAFLRLARGCGWVGRPAARHSQPLVREQHKPM